MYVVSYPSENTHKSQRNTHKRGIRLKQESFVMWLSSATLFQFLLLFQSQTFLEPLYFELHNLKIRCHFDVKIFQRFFFFFLLFDDAVLLCNPPHLPQPLIVTHQRASHLIHSVAMLKGIVHLNEKIPLLFTYVVPNLYCLLTSIFWKSWAIKKKCWQEDE